MATANVTIRMDAELKAAMEELCRDLGMNMTTAFTIFAKKATGENRIPFEVSRPDPFYSESNLHNLRDAKSALDAGEGVEHNLIEE